MIQSMQWQMLQQRLNKQCLPHALLLIGQNHSEMTEFARAFAKLVLCEQARDSEACNNCHACHLMNANSHPDFLCIEPAPKKQTIGVDQIREMVEQVAETPLQGRYRVVVIHPASAMNINAANALLKTLEEPAPNTLIMLVSDESLRLSQTILSRCQRVIFASTQVNKAVNEAFYESLNNLSNGKTDPLQLAAAWQENELIECVDNFSALTADLLRWKVTEEHSYIKEQAMKDNITYLSGMISLHHLLKYTDYLQEARRSLINGANFNKQLLLEDLLIRWKNYVSS